MAGIPKTLNFIDDIIVHGETEKEHDDVLKSTLTVLEENDVLLNTEKCVFKKTTVQFLGHTLTDKGVLPASDKVDAIEKFRAPRNREEVRSFLGLVTYVGKFIPDLATLNEPLRRLIKSEESFVWAEQHEAAFQKIKLAMSDLRTLAYYDPKKPTRVVADASPVGLGAVLLQFHGTEPRAVSYAAKSLSQTERRYSQTEKEALALVWAVERFQLYLVGIEFELETDHRPLEAIFKPTSKPCARVERWVLRLQSFRFRVVYRKGSGNVADCLSRLSRTDLEAKDFDEECEIYIRHIAESAAVDVHDIEEASRTDSEISRVVQSIATADWSHPEVKDYAAFRDEFSVSGALLLRGTKLVIPTALRPRMLEIGHEGHPGETAMKARLRHRCWWPRMDREVKEKVVKCRGCQIVSVPDRPEPMSRRPLPDKPWDDIAIDYLGPIGNSEYILVVVDYFSRYLEVEITNKITAKATIGMLAKMFTRLGFPRTMTLDNARQFVSTELVEWSQNRGIKLIHSIPYWPQANGECERQNRSLLKRLRIAQTMCGDWKAELNDFLQMYYSTPHATTGKTPSELMLGRTIRTKLPSVGDLERAPTTTDFRDEDQLKKAKGKEREDLKRRATASDLLVGDTVLTKNLLPTNKLAPTLNPTPHRVLAKEGSCVTVLNEDTGKTYVRNTAHLKRIPAVEVLSRTQSPAPPTLSTPTPVTPGTPVPMGPRIPNAITTAQLHPRGLSFSEGDAVVTDPVPEQELIREPDVGTRARRRPGWLQDFI